MAVNRYEFALSAAANPYTHKLPAIARAMVEAIDAIEAEQGDPVEDPAVLVLGTFIAFHTHADINTYNGFSSLLELCKARYLETRP